LSFSNAPAIRVEPCFARLNRSPAETVLNRPRIVSSMLSLKSAASVGVCATFINSKVYSRREFGSATYRPTLPVFERSDGLPTDPKEMAETEAIRKNAGLTSTKSALKRLDGLSDSEAEAEVVEIQTEQAANNPFAPPDTGAVDLNGPDGPAIVKRAREIRAANPDLTEQQALDQAAAELQKRAPPGAQK
jgi:hypothetical protein